MVEYNTVIKELTERAEFGEKEDLLLDKFKQKDWSVSRMIEDKTDLAHRYTCEGKGTNVSTRLCLLVNNNKSIARGKIRDREECERAHTR